MSVWEAQAVGFGQRKQASGATAGQERVLIALTERRRTAVSDAADSHDARTLCRKSAALPRRPTHGHEARWWRTLGPMRTVKAIVFSTTTKAVVFSTLIVGVLVVGFLMSGFVPLSVGGAGVMSTRVATAPVPPPVSPGDPGAPEPAPAPTVEPSIPSPVPGPRSPIPTATMTVVPLTVPVDPPSFTAQP